MDGLKRSLEEAIKEMQDIPAATQPSMRPDADLRLARAADTLQSMHPMPEPETVYGAVHEIPAASAADFVPTADSIEAALSSAPAVSPHYVAPEPVAVAPEPPVAPARAQLVNTASTSAVQQPLPKRRALRFGSPKVMRPAPVRPAKKIGSTFPNAQSDMREQSGHYEPSSSGGLDRGDVEGLAAIAAQKTSKRPDNFWRWTTITISCVGGLASGWLGSNFSDQNTGVFRNSVQTIVGRASDGVSAMRPASIKIVPQGAAKFMSGSVIGGLPMNMPGNMTGKTDRAVPLDEDLCTVLELDRGTGLTLARPCKMIETAGFNTTLGKSDLLAKSK